MDKSEIDEGSETERNCCGNESLIRKRWGGSYVGIIEKQTKNKRQRQTEEMITGR